MWFALAAYYTTKLVDPHALPLHTRGIILQLLVSSIVLPWWCSIHCLWRDRVKGRAGVRGGSVPNRWPKALLAFVGPRVPALLVISLPVVAIAL